MAQARVHLPETTPLAPLLQRRGFRWCRKDQRWEKNCGNPEAVLLELKEDLPDQNLEVSHKL